MNDHPSDDLSEDRIRLTTFLIKTPDSLGELGVLLFYGLWG